MRGTLGQPDNRTTAGCPRCARRGPGQSLDGAEELASTRSATEPSGTSLEASASKDTERRPVARERGGARRHRTAPHRRRTFPTHTPASARPRGATCSPAEPSPSRSAGHSRRPAAFLKGADYSPPHEESTDDYPWAAPQGAPSTSSTPAPRPAAPAPGTRQRRTPGWRCPPATPGRPARPRATGSAQGAIEVGRGSTGSCPGPCSPFPLRTWTSTASPRTPGTAPPPGSPTRAD